MKSIKGYNPKATKEPVVDYAVLKRIEKLEGRIAQFEATLSTTLKNTITFESLATRLMGNTGSNTKKVRKPRAKRELTPEQKAAFHAKMVAGRLAKEIARLAASKK